MSAPAHPPLAYVTAKLDGRPVAPRERKREGTARQQARTTCRADFTYVEEVTCLHWTWEDASYKF